MSDGLESANATHSAVSSHNHKFNPIDVTSPHVVYTVLGGFTVLFGMFSLFIREKMYIGEACLAFIFGVVVGPYGANIFNPRDWTKGNEDHVNEITLEITRVVLAIGVFAIGVELPKAYMAKHWKSLFFLLGPCMAYGWFVSAGIIYALIPALSFKSSLAVAAALTPTDPILAAAVIGGGWADKHVPTHLRHLLAAESGCNDGAAFPFLFIAIYLTIYDDVGLAIRDWILITWLYEIVLSVFLGALMGWLFRQVMKFCERKNLIDRQSYVAQYVSLAMFSNGVTTLIGSDDLLAAFASGAAFAWDGFFNRQTEATVFSSVIDLLFNVATFIYIGAWMPFDAFTNEILTLKPWRLIVIAILVLLLRRLPAILALYRWIPDIKTFREAVFAGHFGPMGVGAIFIATLAAKELGDVPETGPENQQQILAASIQPIVSFMVLCSIAVHGLSIPFFSLSKRVHTVRRTWSRQHSKEGSPEWAHGVRRADAPEGVVINQDATMPNGATGSASGSENEKTRIPDDEAERRARAIPDVLDGDVQSDDEESPTPSSRHRRPTHPAVLDATRYLDDHAAAHADGSLMPKGRILSKEWQEGPHLVIEHRAEDDDTGEVEVTVVRNAFASNEQLQLEREIKQFTVASELVKHEVQQHIESFGQQAQRKLGELLHRVSSSSLLGGSDPGHDKGKAKDSSDKEQDRGDIKIEVERPGDDDEWLDEPGQDQLKSSPHRARKTKRRTSVSSGQSGSPVIARPVPARRRGSASGNRPHVPPISTSNNSSSSGGTDIMSPDADTPSRGRMSAVPGRLRPRELSPARSIRFAISDDTAHDRDAPMPISPRATHHARSGSGLGLHRTQSNNGGSGLGLPRTASNQGGSGLGMSRTSSIQGGSGLALSRTSSIQGGSGLGLTRTSSAHGLGGSGVGLPSRTQTQSIGGENGTHTPQRKPTH
ncbi:Sodium/hydrogen exchanger family-domain-containing protein [Auriculariales sp. MPI-PUGE-AT-0066]|nr:Sodium/hydrogen exchanger family-domain-containing protein [Auriculariales sp. MPI-PUGE-AT-0066]